MCRRWPHNWYMSNGDLGHKTAVVSLGNVRFRFTLADGVCSHQQGDGNDILASLRGEDPLPYLLADAASEAVTSDVIAWADFNSCMSKCWTITHQKKSATRIYVTSETVWGIFAVAVKARPDVQPEWAKRAIVPAMSAFDMLEDRSYTRRLLSYIDGVGGEMAGILRQRAEGALKQSLLKEPAWKRRRTRI